MGTRHRRNSAVGIVKTLKDAYGAAWGRFTKEQKRHEFDDQLRLLRSIKVPANAKNPFL